MSHVINYKTVIIHYTVLKLSISFVDLKLQGINQSSVFLSGMLKSSSYYILQILFGKIIMSTFLDLRRLRLIEMSSPALEKSLSEGTEVPRMHKYFFASGAKLPKRFSFSFHQSSGSSCLGTRSSAK